MSSRRSSRRPIGTAKKRRSLGQAVQPSCRLCRSTTAGEPANKLSVVEAKALWSSGRDGSRKVISMMQDEVRHAKKKVPWPINVCFAMASFDTNDVDEDIPLSCLSPSKRKLELLSWKVRGAGSTLRLPGPDTKRQWLRAMVRQCMLPWSRSSRVLLLLLHLLLPHQQLQT